MVNKHINSINKVLMNLDVWNSRTHYTDGDNPLEFLLQFNITINPRIVTHCTGCEKVQGCYTEEQDLF